MNTEQEIQNLKDQVAELMAWKEERTRQQITFPLDINSFKVLNKYFLSIFGSFVQTGGAAGRLFTFFLAKQDTYKTALQKVTTQVFTAVASTDVCTAIDYPYANDDRVYLVTSGTLPAGLSAISTYYIVNASGMTFKLSLTSGGAAVNITDAGSGVQYIDYL